MKTAVTNSRIITLLHRVGSLNETFHVCIPEKPSLLLPPPRICPPHISITGVGVAFGEGFLLIRLFSLREERPIYLTLFAANCLKAGLSGDELCGPSPSDHGSLDAWIIFLGPIDWR